MVSAMAAMANHRRIVEKKHFEERLRNANRNILIVQNGKALVETVQDFKRVAPD